MSSFFTELKRRNVVRVAVAYAVIGWLVLQVTNTLVSMLELTASVEKLILLILIVGYIPMLLFSWVYELTPQGFKLESQITAGETITAHTAKRLDVVTLIALIGVVSLSVWQYVSHGVLISETESGIFQSDTEYKATLLQDSQENPVAKSIAVLPFVNISSDTDNEYFSDGISEEILSALAKIKQLKVVSRTSSFAFKDQMDNLQLIGEILGVEYVLEGSVRKSENSIRITAQLINVSDGFHVWSETYDRELTDVFAIQDEIAQHIVQAMRITLVTDGLGTQSENKVNPVAYDLFLQARHLWHKRGENNLLEAISLYEKAVAIDPDFSRAWAALAVATANMIAYSTIPIEEIMPKAQGYAFRALALNPNLSEAIMVLPILMAYEKRWDEMLVSLDKAVKLDPSNSTARIWKSETLWRMGYLDQAYQELEAAVAIDPTSPPAIYNMAYYKLRMGDVEGALKLTDVIKDHNFKNASYLQALIALEQNNQKLAYELLPKAFAILGLSDEESTAIVAGLSDKNQRDKALAALDQLGTDIIEKRVSKFNVDIVLEMYKQFDEPERAFKLANALVDDGTAFIDYSFWGKQNKAIRQHPKFQAIVRKRGFLKYWLLNGWPDECKPDGENIICD